MSAIMFTPPSEAPPCAPFNINCHVWVRLTDLGRKVLNDAKVSYGESKDGWSRFQLRRVMVFFGQHLACPSFTPPFETTIYVEAESFSFFPNRGAEADAALATAQSEMDRAITRSKRSDEAVAAKIDRTPDQLQAMFFGNYNLSVREFGAVMGACGRRPCIKAEDKADAPPQPQVEKAVAVVAKRVRRRARCHP